jgi:hypothetical protein
MFTQNPTERCNLISEFILRPVSLHNTVLISFPTTIGYISTLFIILFGYNSRMTDHQGQGHHKGESTTATLKRAFGWDNTPKMLKNPFFLGFLGSLFVGMTLLSDRVRSISQHFTTPNFTTHFMTFNTFLLLHISSKY